MNDRMIDMMGGDQGALPGPDYPCPRCGAETETLYECQTWEGPDGKRMSCVPCDSAIRFFCLGRVTDDETCQWEYVYGSHRPHDKDNIGREKPDWLVGRLKLEFYAPPDEDDDD